jgi:3-(3-hydroxy-phenyl)propionate hydroxylase
VIARARQLDRRDNRLRDAAPLLDRHRLVVSKVAANEELGDRIASGFIHPTAPHAGTQLVQGKVGGRPFDEVHGNGWRLVLHDADAEAVGAAGQDWFATIGGKVVALDEPDSWFDRWFTEHATAYALMRPDFYLYGTAPTPAGASALLADLRTHLAKGATT